MKKVLVVLLVLAMVFGGVVLPRPVSAQKEFFLTLVVGINVYQLNGISKTADVPPQIVNGRTFVPIRLVSESFGADVNWNASSKTVTIKSDTTTIVLKVGSTKATVNGKTVTLDAAPYILGGRTMVPIRFISESLGLSVYYEPQKKIIYVSAKPSYTVPGVTDTQITIGTFAAQSGAVAIVGVPFYHGLQAYLNYINDNGGVYGRKIKLLVEDDQANPALTVPAVKKLVEENHVYAIVGGVGTPGCLAVMDYLNNNGVPFIYQASGSSQLANPPKKYVFAVQPNYYNEGQIFVKYALSLGLKNFALLYEDDDAGNEGAQGVQQGVTRFGGNLVYKSSFPATETDFTSYLLKVKSSNADVLFIYAPVYTNLGANILKTAQSLGLTQKMFLPYSYAGITATAGAAAENAYVSGWVDFSNPNDPGVQKFFQIWNKYYPNDNQLLYAYAVAGFVAGEIFVEALKRAGKYPTRDALVWALETFNGWSGYVAKDISYGPNERAGKYSMFFMQIQKGQLVKVSDWISVK